MDSLSVQLAPLIVAVMALCFSVYNFAQSRHRRRRKLLNAIYHHATRAMESLSEQQKANRAIRKTIESDESYTPYVVAVSPANELVYDQVIEAMEWLNPADEKTMLRYFHSQSNLHALGQSFNSDFVRSWNRERKLAMWSILEKELDGTLQHARAVKSFYAPRGLRGEYFRGWGECRDRTQNQNQKSGGCRAQNENA